MFGQPLPDANLIADRIACIHEHGTTCAVEVAEPEISRGLPDWEPRMLIFHGTGSTRAFAAVQEVAAIEPDVHVRVVGFDAPDSHARHRPLALVWRRLRPSAAAA
jgi:ribulose bisphosphate carboxylase small subunit